MNTSLSRLMSVGCILAGIAWVLWGGAEPLSAQVMPDPAGGDWGAYKPQLEAKLLGAGLPANHYEVKGLGGQVLSGPQPGDAVVKVEPAPNTPLDATVSVFVTVARLKIPDYTDPDNPVPLWAAEAWLKAVDPTIVIDPIVKQPEGTETSSPSPVDWWFYVLSFIRMPDKNGPVQSPGTEIPAGATVALIVTDPAGVYDDAQLLIIIQVIINIFLVIFGVATFLKARKAERAANSR